MPKGMETTAVMRSQNNIGKQETNHYIEGERKRDKETERDRDSERQRQTNRQIERQTDRRDREREAKIE